jgi:uncharacterized protein with PQ loop repeat
MLMPHLDDLDTAMGYFFSVTAVFLYLPQFHTILKRQSTFGLSISTLCLAAMSSISSFFTVFVLDYYAIVGCSKLGMRCVPFIQPFLQSCLAIAVITPLYSVALVIYARYDVHDPHLAEALARDPEHGPPHALGLPKRKFFELCSLGALALVFTACFLLLYFSAGICSALMRAYAQSQGVLSSLFTALQWLPQIIMTLDLKVKCRLDGLKLFFTVFFRGQYQTTSICVNSRMFSVSDQCMILSFHDFCLTFGRLQEKGSLNLTTLFTFATLDVASIFYLRHLNQDWSIWLQNAIDLVMVASLIVIVLYFDATPRHHRSGGKSAPESASLFDSLRRDGDGGGAGDGRFSDQQTSSQSPSWAASASAIGVAAGGGGIVAPGTVGEQKRIFESRATAAAAAVAATKTRKSGGRLRSAHRAEKTSSY